MTRTNASPTRLNRGRLSLAQVVFIATQLLTGMLLAGGFSTPRSAHGQETLETDPAILPAADMGLEGVDDIAALDLEALLSVPVVEAASRREQSIHEAPVSVTLIDSEELQRMPLFEVTDALEQVVGIDVARKTVTNPNLGSRGFSEESNNRLPLLIDGRMVNTPFQDGPNWAIVGVHPADLERIEVVHGPGSTLYGANAVSGVILLTSKRPLDHSGTEALGAATLSVLPDIDDDSYSKRPFNASGIAYAAQGLANEDQTIGARISLGLGQTPEALPDTIDTSPGIHGPHRIAGRLAFDYRPGDHQRVELDLSMIEQESRFRGFAGGGARRMYGEEAIRLFWSDSSWLDDTVSTRFQADARRLKEKNNDLIFNTERIHSLALVDVKLAAVRSVITAGGELAYERFDGFSLGNGRRLYAAAVLQNETALTESRSVLLNAGLRSEQIKVRAPDSRITYRNLNPRAALIWRLQKQHDLRASFNTAYRTPTPSESLVGVTFSQPEGVPTVRAFLPATDLEPESILAYELGYRGEFGGKLYTEVSGYFQQIRRLTQLSTTSEQPIYSANLQDLDQAGVEFTGHFQPFTWLEARASYSYVHTLYARIDPESSYMPSHLASASVDLEPSSEWQVRADASLASTLTQYQSITVGRITRQELSTIPARTRLHLKAARNVMDGRAQVFVAARNIIGMFRTPETQLETSDGDPIGTQIMLGISLFDEATNTDRPAAEAM